MFIGQKYDIELSLTQPFKFTIFLLCDHALGIYMLNWSTSLHPRHNDIILFKIKYPHPSNRSFMFSTLPAFPWKTHIALYFPLKPHSQSKFPVIFLGVGKYIFWK